MKRTKEKDISSFFKKRICKEIVNTTSPNPIPTQASKKNSSSSTHIPPFDETGGIALKQESETESGDSSNVRTEALIDHGRLSKLDVRSLPQDPGERRKMSAFHPNHRDMVRREYIRRKPFQPNFSQSPFEKTVCRFNRRWFGKYKPWLEYSVTKEAAFCFICYLFENEVSVGGDAFVSEGFRTWSKSNAFDEHVGGPLSAHNQALRSLNDFQCQMGSIICFFQF
ncbi:uncharacterized protein [Spinacia oleracea]|uniref:TTF-type domain-containing protein n=1 Tax=Spinacia oleracea TaxID=3562 RepID=A0A9R0HRL2_SPIOL|nr:uncharacterized protein LOC110775078 [Spinacia oleracea]